MSQGFLPFFSQWIFVSGQLYFENCWCLSQNLEFLQFKSGAHSLQYLYPTSWWSLAVRAGLAQLLLTWSNIGGHHHDHVEHGSLTGRQQPLTEAPWIHPEMRSLHVRNHQPTKAPPFSGHHFSKPVLITRENVPGTHSPSISTPHHPQPPWLPYSPLPLPLSPPWLPTSPRSGK